MSEALEVGLLAGATEDAARIGYDVLSISGGEPFLYPDLPALLTAARDAGMRTTVTTNGTVLTASRLEAVRDLVDLVAVSLDGGPAVHDRIRARAGTFDRAVAGMRLLAGAGVAFGVITTLTAHNAPEIAGVAVVAAEAGAGLLQVHPLEPEGAAARLLADEVPDARELTYAAVEIMRVARSFGLPVQFDAVPWSRFRSHPRAFMAGESVPDGPLGRWLTPLVIEADGTVVPVSYGFDRGYALGSLHAASLAALASRWDHTGFRRLCRDTWERLAGGHAQPFVQWYDELVRASRQADSVRYAAAGAGAQAVDVVVGGARGFGGVGDHAEVAGRR